MVTRLLTKYLTLIRLNKYVKVSMMGHLNIVIVNYAHTFKTIHYQAKRMYGALE